MKQVSVIIPCYNVASYIEQCLDSVLGQTYQNLDIVVVDDGSTDTTLGMLKEYQKKDTRIRIVSKENGGLASARNAGLAVATGTYFILLDSDDVMMSEKVATQVAWMENTTCDVMYSDLYHFWDGTSAIYRLDIPELSHDQYEGLLKGNHINPNTICMNRSVYERIGGFDESLRSAEDWEYWLRIAQAGINIGYLSKPLTLYRMRTNSLSADAVTMYTTALQVLEKQKTFSITAVQQTIIANEIARWNVKLTLALMNADSSRKSFVKRCGQALLVTLVRMIRKVRLWWRLKRVHNAAIEALLKPYAK